MTLATVWRTDDPCGGCGTGLLLPGDGPQLTAGCRSCGTADTWASNPDDRDTNHLGRDGQ